jgi:hypothetical protein
MIVCTHVFFLLIISTHQAWDPTLILYSGFLNTKNILYERFKILNMQICIYFRLVRQL